MESELVRHLIATIAYRASKTLEHPPGHFADLSIGEEVRTPKAILMHMNQLTTFVEGMLSLKSPSTIIAVDHLDFTEATSHFFHRLAFIDQTIAAGASPTSGNWDTMLQGPLADMLTHVGQLALLRRMSGSPVPGESFMRADIHAGYLRRPLA